MRTVEQALDVARRRLQSDWPDPDQAGRWPLRISLRTAGKTDAERDFPAVHAWASTWKYWCEDKPVTLEWANRRVHGTTQPLPRQLLIANADDAAAVSGDQWVSRLAQARTRRARLAQRFPDVDPGPTVRAVADLSDVDFELLLDAADWFTHNNAAGLSPRQVPIAGLHAKWLDVHGSLVRRLTGREHLGLIDRPGVVRYAYVDPEYRASGGRRYGAVTIVEPDVTLTPEYRPDVVVIVENLDTMLHFPPLSGGMVVCGWGSAATLLPRIPWIRDAARVIYWGDIDVDGFQILDRLRRDGVPAVSVLMDLVTLNEYEAFASPTDPSGRALGPGVRKDTPALTPTEQEAYEALTIPDWPGPWRLEQERIPLAVGLAAIVGLWSANRPQHDRGSQRA